jgi:hypothetical protein
MRFLFFVVLFVATIHGDAVDVIDRAIHGELADDNEYNIVREELEMPDMNIAPPADIPEASPWELEESEVAIPDVEKVDEWEAVPLPATHHEEQMMKDSEAIAQIGSEARRELEEELAEAAAAMENVRPAIEANLVDSIIVGKIDAKRIVVEEIQIFNTDDFDGEESDVDGDQPVVPR